MVRPIFCSLSQYAPKPDLISTYKKASTTCAVSVACAAIGLVTGNRAWMVAAGGTLCLPLVKWYKAPVFAMGRDLCGETPLKQLQNLYGDMIQCGLDGENRANAKEQLRKLKEFPKELFVDEHLQLVDVSQQLNEIETVLNRTNETTVFATLNYDLERLYFEVCLNGGVMNNTQTQKYNGILALIQKLKIPAATNPYSERLKAIYAGCHKEKTDTTQWLAFDARVLLLKLQRGTISTDDARTQNGVLVGLFQKDPNCILKSELQQDLIQINALLTSRQQIKASAFPMIQARAVPVEQPRAAAVPKCGLPNHGRPKLMQICWLNASCQLIFRSGMIKYIEQKVKDGTATPMLKLLYELKEAIVRGKSTEEIRDIQEKIVLLYKANLNDPNDTTFKVGTQHDGIHFMRTVITDLNQTLSTSIGYSKNDLLRCPALPKNPTKSTQTELTAGYKPHHVGFASCMVEVPIVANPTARDKQGNEVRVTLRRELTDVPPFLIMRFMGLENRPKGQAIPLKMDFSHYFTEEVQKGHAGKLSYRLAASDVHSNPGKATGGHHTAQEQDEYTYYDDAYVTHLPVSEAYKKFVDSPVQIWERCEDAAGAQDVRADVKAGNS